MILLAGMQNLRRAKKKWEEKFADCTKKHTNNHITKQKREELHF